MNALNAIYINPRTIALLILALAFWALPAQADSISDGPTPTTGSMPSGPAPTSGSMPTGPAPTTGSMPTGPAPTTGSMPQRERSIAINSIAEAIWREEMCRLGFFEKIICALE